MSERLDILRGSLKTIAEYEGRQTRSARHKREKLAGFIRHLQTWNREAEAVSSGEKCPLLKVIEQYADDTGTPLPGQLQPQEPTTVAKHAAPTGKTRTRQANKSRGKGKSPSKTPPKGGDAAPPAASHDESQQAETGTDDGEGGILPKGPWLKSHADIIEREVPQVKAAAADPDNYLAAKKAFLKRNLPKLRAYIKKPLKGHSPLFTYCALFHFDAGDLAAALKLAEKAIELRQQSAVKRDFHQIHADLQKEHLEREAEALAAKGGQPGQQYQALKALREKLMASPFRGNHWKAGVCKTFGNLAFVLGEYETAKLNLNQVKFLDPNMGVETLLGKVEDALKKQG